MVLKLMVKLGYIMVTEQANEILIAVEERRNFILRTVFAIAIAIFIFSIFLNKYILTPIAAIGKLYRNN